MKNNSITLIGMAGSGKSAIGEILAKMLNWQFVDLDKLILEKNGITHHQIMEKNGAEELTRLENEYTLDLDFANLIFSPPGSIIYSPSAMEKITKNSIIVYLQTDPAIVEKRLGERLYQNGIVGLKEKGLKKLMEERAVLYQKYADFTFHSNEQTKQEMVEIVLSGLKKANAIL